MKVDIDSHSEFLRVSGADASVLTDQQRHDIDALGYCLMPINPTRWRALGISIDELRARVDELVETEGTFAGREGKEDTLDGVKVLEPGASRLGNLVNKGDCFRRLMMMPELLALADHALKSEFKLSSLNFREPLPGQNQRIHIDWMPRNETDGASQLGILMMVFLDDSNLDNGPLKVLPGTHLKTGWPDEYLDPFKAQANEILVTAPAGSVVAMNVNLFHGGTINVTGKRRRTLMVNYRRRNLPQLLNQRRYLSPEVMNDLSPAERYLLAVRLQDPRQTESSAGVAAAYAAAWGHSDIARAD